MNNLVRKCIKAIRLSQNALWLKGLTHGIGAAIEHKPFLNDIDCNTIIDVGANCGQFALAARALCPSAKIHSFEPLNGPAEKFLSLFSCDKKVSLHRVALGVTHEKKTMHLSKSIDSSSLLPISDLQDILFPGTAEAGEITVDVQPLSEVINLSDLTGTSLLKVDVQGYELEVLQGCGELLAKFSHIYVECSFVELYEGQALAGEVIEYLHKANYSLRGIYNLARDDYGHSVQADFHFSNNSTSGN